MAMPVSHHDEEGGVLAGCYAAEWWFANRRGLIRQRTAEGSLGLSASGLELLHGRSREFPPAAQSLRHDDGAGIPPAGSCSAKTWAAARATRGRKPGKPGTMERTAGLEPATWNLEGSRAASCAKSAKKKPRPKPGKSISRLGE